MNSNSEDDKGKIWKLFFVSSGFVSLFIWNSLFNLIDYFEKGLEVNSFNLITFIFCFGQVASFLTSSVVFSKYKIRFSLNIAVGSVLFSFFCMVYFVEFTRYTEINKICVILAALVMGYMSALFQSKSFGLAAQHSVEEVLYVSFGTGLAGVLTNLFSFFVSLFFPTNDDTEELSTLRKQVLLYMFMTVLSFLVYLIIQHEFHYLYSKSIEKLETGEREIEHAFSDIISFDTRRVEEEWRIVNTVKGLLFNTLFLYSSTVLFVVYLNVKCYFSFDDNKNAFTVAYYMFFFNVSDTIGKLLPEKLTFKGEFGIMAVNLVRFLCLMFLTLILGGKMGDVFVAPWVRMLLNVFLGFTNGLLTNSVYDQCVRRFKSKNDRGKAEYLVVLLIVVGVAIGALFGVVFNDLHLD